MTGTYGALERVGQHLPATPEGSPRERFWRIRANSAVLAAGALERPIAFPNNDRPGIMTAGAVRAYLNRYGVAPGGVTVFGNNDDAHRTAFDLQEAGVHVAAVIDSRGGCGPKGDYRLIRGRSGHRHRRATAGLR
jgi:NADPH-dependent 2,4-dienoyl-CoA reductase/sulfur reductase-like enzyme